MSRRRRKKKKRLLHIILFILIGFIYGYLFDEINNSFGLMYEDINQNITNPINNNNNNLDINQANLKVYYLDVGQADSILINSNNEYMIIDGGNDKDGKLIVNYLKGLKVNKIKYVIGTHPHEDHIGGLDDIINSFDIEKIYIPDAMTTTKTFENLLDAIENKKMVFNVPKIGDKLTLGNSTIEFIYTGTDTTDLNNTSIVIRLIYKNTSFLFTGDATDTSEKKIINSNINIKSDVLKVGHHGSNYSSTLNFLKKVNPKYAVISVGKNNMYGHPGNSTLSRLEKLNIIVHRTDQEGTIIATSDGTNIIFSNEKTNTNGG